MARQNAVQSDAATGGRRTGRSRTRSWLLWGGVAAAAIVLGATALASRSQADGQTSGGISRAGQNAAPEFSLTLYQGADVLGADELSFSSVLGRGQPVVLNFWAGLCPPCRAEMPAFQKVYDELGHQFVLLGLDVGPFTGLGSNTDGRNLLRELGITYPAGMTAERAVMGNFRVLGMPTTVFLTANGEVLDTHIGLLDETTFRSKVERLLQETGSS